MSKLQKTFLENVNGLLAGRTFYWLAKESGVAQASLSRIASGKFEPKFSTIEAFAKALNVNAADLLREPVKGEIPADIIKMLENQDKLVYDAIRAILKQMQPRKK